MDYPVSVPNVSLLNGKFTDGNPIGGVPASLDPSEWSNLVTDEMLNVILAAGLTPSETSNNQLALAIQSGALNSSPDSGIANTYVVTLDPAPPQLSDGLIIHFQATNANNGASTLNVNGLGAKQIIGASNAALKGGEIVAGGKISVIWSATFACFLLLSATGGSLSISSGRLVRTSLYTIVGGIQQVSVDGGGFTPSSTWTALPLTSKIRARALGSGGAGGGTSLTSATQISIGAGGSAGSYAEAIFIAGLFSSPQPVTVGPGAAGVAGAQGNNGSTTSFGSLVSAPGGVGGLAGGAISNSSSSYNYGASPGTLSFGGTILNARGTPGGDGLYIVGTPPRGGNGGSNQFGSGGFLSGYGNGQTGSGYGTGGSGACANVSSAVQAGGNSQPGVLFIEEFA